MNFKKLLEDCKKNSSNKNISNLLIVVLILVLALVTISAFKGASTQAISSNQESAGKVSEIKSSDGSMDVENKLEDKLKSTLELIDGVGKVETMVYFESGEEQVPALNVNNSTNYTEENDNQGGTRKTTQTNSDDTVVVTNNGDKTEPLIVKTYKPKISGVIVVAEGANDKVVQYKITQAVINLFDISADKVNVYAMKK